MELLNVNLNKVDNMKEINRQTLHNLVSIGNAKITSAGSENIYITDELGNEFFHKGDDPQNYYEKYFLDFVNNFVSSDGFARHYDFTPCLAREILMIGRGIHYYFCGLNEINK